MVSLSNIKNVYLYGPEISFRCGITGLTTIILSNFKESELDNSVFVFFSSRKDKIKIIEFDNTGIWMYEKVLLNRRFILPVVEDRRIKIDKSQLNEILTNLKIVAKKNKEISKNN